MLAEFCPPTCYQGSLATASSLLQFLLTSPTALFGFQFIPALPGHRSRTLGDLPRSCRKPFLFIPTLITPIDPIRLPLFLRISTGALPVFFVWALSFPVSMAGRRTMNATSGSLLLRAEDSPQTLQTPRRRDALSVQHDWTD